MAAPTPGPVEIERALQGQSAVLDAKDAVSRLARSGLSGARERLVQLVREEPAIAPRRRAALGLSLMADARSALLDLVDVTEPTVLAAVLLSLARVGSEEDVRTIRAAAARLYGPPAEQGRFAELLLAHRLGLSRDLVRPIPAPPDTQASTRATEIAQGAAQEAVIAWSRFAANAHLGFEPNPSRCAVLHCEQRNLLLIPSIELATEIGARLRRARVVVGATASYEREAGRWLHDLWILSTPTPDGVELQAWTQGGLPCYTGPGRVSEESLAFELRTTAASRLALVDVRGRLTQDSLEVTGTVGDRPRSDARTPELRVRPQ